MKGFRKSLSALLITAAMAATVVVPAVAAGTNYEPIAAQNAKFKKILVIDSNADIPTLSFDYTVASGTAIAATATTLPVYAGVGSPTIATVPFSKTTDSVDSPTKVADHQTITKDITVSMSGITFSEPGVYRYIITETVPASRLGGLYYDVLATNLTSETGRDYKRTLDVYVEDNGTDSSGKKLLKVTGYILYDGEVTTAPPSSSSASSGTAITSETTITVDVNAAQTNVVAGETKTDNYMNYYTSQSLTFGKVVTGNQGSRDKYFKLTLELTSPVATTVAVDVSNADPSLPSATNLNKATDPSYAEATNTTSITLTANTKVTTNFYLQHGQYIIVNGLPIGTVYNLTETEEGYTKTAGITAAVSVINWDGVAGNDAMTDPTSGTITLDDGDATTNTDGNIETGYTNDKQGVIPTGVLLTMTPVIIVAVVVVAGIAFFAVRSAKRKALELADSDSEEEAE